MAARKVFAKPIEEGTDWVYEVKLLNLAGAPVPNGAIQSITLLLHALDAAKTIINNVGPTPVDIMNAGRGVYDGATAKLTINFLPGDSVILDDTVEIQKIIALITWTYNSGGGTKTGRRDVQFKIRNLARLP